MTDRASVESLEGLRQRLVDAIASVYEEECCDCGKPYSAHEYWEDRIYDVNGRKCPGSVTGSEYRYSEWRTADYLRLRRMAAASLILQPFLDHERDQGQRQACMEPSPDRSGRTCDKPKGHDGPHWTYGGNTLTWPQLGEQGQRLEQLTADVKAWYAANLQGREQIASQAKLIRDQGQRISELEQRASRLEDAAFHFQTCATCRKNGEDSCVSGRQFAAFLRGEGDDS